MREAPDLPIGQLRACCQQAYDLSAAIIEFLPLGYDSRSAVYRVVSDQGTSYLLKARANPLYEAGYLVPRYLREQGIEAVVAPLLTNTATLWHQLGEWRLILYPFIEGEHGWASGMTAAQWQAVGAAIKQIHQVALPPADLDDLRRETFTPVAYISAMNALEAQYITGIEGGSQVEQTLRSHWEKHQATIHLAATALETLAAILQTHSGPYNICHADLHPGNIIRQPPNRIFVIDWDDVMLAPKERDFIFVEEPTIAAPFFRGYGQAEAIDWVALTYYLWERTIQDVIAYAEEVLLRDDLGAATKEDSAARFNDILSPGNSAERALAASTHLPADLISHP